ncbi:hypothetical protein WJX82_009429 [Trebouxia sp. C0006]
MGCSCTVSVEELNRKMDGLQLGHTNMESKVLKISSQVQEQNHALVDIHWEVEEVRQSFAVPSGRAPGPL